jgi:prolyl-tRNA synthetase
MAKKITDRSEDYSQWYHDVIREAKLADQSPVRGSMVIRPNGFAIWENMKEALDGMFKDTGHENAYFPLFIPKSFLSKEAQHVEGFAKECAVVTHSRLRSTGDGVGVEVDPESRLEEELIVRPTSETIIWDSYRNWIQSYRDLPILINQWANVVRWELRTRMFLRTMEFLWQEGHTAHATKEEAVEETEQMLEVYRTFAEEYMAMPVVTGLKTASERFAGAEQTYCIESLMQDNKALQAGTSHFLGQNFAKAFDVKFQSAEGEHEYVWATSWGVSTRLIGGLIMTHSDDNGLVLPPKLARVQAVIVPIWRDDEQKADVLEYCDRITGELEEAGVKHKLDDRDSYNPGRKFAEHEAAGIPLRIAVGPRDLKNNNVELARRDTLEKNIVDREGLGSRIKDLLDQIQHDLYAAAEQRINENTHHVDSYEEFKKVMDTDGGFVYAHWDGTPETEEKIKEDTKATIRCIPLEGDKEAGDCMVTGEPSSKKVLFAKSY